MECHIINLSENHYFFSSKSLTFYLIKLKVPLTVTFVNMSYFLFFATLFNIIGKQKYASIIFSSTYSQIIFFMRKPINANVYLNYFHKMILIRPQHQFNENVIIPKVKS